MGDSIFSGLESMGLGGLDGVSLFGEEKKETAEKQAEQPVDPVKIEADFLLEKTTICPICNTDFKEKFVKTGRAKLVSQDMDLRPKHQGIDVSKYDVISCPICGYTALAKYFPTLLDSQKKKIREKICVNYRGTNEHTEIYSYEQAATRYKLALFNAAVKGAKASEIGYICLKASWVMRGWAEELGESSPEYAKVKAMEAEYTKNAYEGFVKGVAGETFPMAGMDEMTVNYLIAVLALKTGHLDVSQKMVAAILTSKTASNAMKDKARTIKDEIIKKLKA